MADPDQVPNQERHGRAAPASGRLLLERRLRLDQAALLHDPPGQTHDLVVEQEEAGQVVPVDQAELFVQPRRDLPVERAIASDGGFVAEPPEVALRRVTLRHQWLRQRVAEVGVEPEAALRGDSLTVVERFGQIGEQLRHLRLGLEVQMAIRMQMAQRLVQRRVVFRRDQRLLQAVTLGCVVMHVVCGDQPRVKLAGQ